METYNTNKAFKSYVDKYCKEYGLTVAEALQDSIVQEVEKQHIKNASMVALEKQKTKKPIYDKPIGVLECPCCGNYLQKVVDDEGSTEGFIPNHCSNCGQNIDADWSDL